MRCAACNVVLEPARIAAGDGRCACGAELDLPGGARARADVEPSPPAPPSPSGPELTSYRSAPSVSTPATPVVELAHVGADLACPRCRETLTYAFQGSYDVHECRRCFGAFVEAKALTTFIAEARTTGTADVGIERQAGPLPGVPIDKLARCPSCKTHMTRTVFGRRSGVLVDVCTEHGTWFDAGELAKVLAFEATGGAARVAQKEQEEAKAREVDPLLAREQARAQAVLLQEQVQEARAVGRWASFFESRNGFVDWLGRAR